MDISNETKANEIANAFFIENVSAENEQVIREMLNKSAFEAMQWKDEQFKIVVSKLLKKLAKYDMLDATLCASGLLNLSKQEAQQYIKTLLL